MEGISNIIWGPVYWKMFHYVTLTYPLSPKDDDKQRIKDFFSNIVPHILPCPFCRVHYKKNLEINPLTDDILDIKFKLVIWLINMHNYVNKQLGKNEMTIEDALISLFIPENIKKKESITKSSHINDKYSLDNLRKSVNNIIFTESDNLIFDINKVISDKEQELKNKRELDEYMERLKEEERKKKGSIQKNEKKELTKEEKDEYEKNLENYNKQMNEIVNLMNKKKGSFDIPEVKITQQNKIDMNKIIEKIHDLINENDDEKIKFLLYSGLESICFIF
jgi:hypothetical protein